MSAPHGWFRAARSCDDLHSVIIHDCKRPLGILDSPGKRQIDAAEGFGNCMGGATTVANKLVPGAHSSGMASAVSRARSCLGSYNQSKWIPVNVYAANNWNWNVVGSK